jgi:hypothetical protein
MEGKGEEGREDGGKGEEGREGRGGEGRWKDEERILLLLES